MNYATSALDISSSYPYYSGYYTLVAGTSGYVKFTAPLGMYANFLQRAAQTHILRSILARH